MKTPLFRQPLFYLSALLAGVLVFQIYSVVSAQTNWVGPSGSPPAGNSAQPLDTSSAAQTKKGTIILNAGSGVAALRIEGDSTICLKEGATGNITCKPAYWDQIGSGGRGDSLWTKTDPVLSVVPGPNIFYKEGAVFVGEYPKKPTPGTPQLLYFPRYRVATTNTTQEGINFSSYNFAWETNSASVNALGTNDRLACDADAKSIRDCFGGSSLAQGSAASPAIKYNVASAVESGASFTFSGPYAQIYDKADSSKYYYRQTTFDNSAAKGVRLWCDSSDGSNEAEASADLNGGILQLGEYGADCPETLLPAPPPGVAGGWPDKVVDYVTTVIDNGYDDPQRGYISNIYAITGKRVYSRQQAQTAPIRFDYIALNPNGGAEFAGGKLSISPSGNIYLEKGQGISLSQGWISMTGSISTTNLYLAGETKVNGKRVYQIVGGCTLNSSEECVPGTKFGDIDDNGKCSSGATRVGGKTVGSAFCAY